ncbi:oligopeptide transporter 5 [Physcia stellaris]|nr:oligopeptide transporter 5 [Physcia stellaris]
MLQWFRWREPTNPVQRHPREDEDYETWLDTVEARAETRPERFHPVVKELQALIDNSTRVRQLAQGMYDEVASRPPPGDQKVPYRTDIEDHNGMLRVLNCFLTVPILWSSYRYLIGWTSCPILSIFWRPLHTTCGFAFFQDPECWFSPEALAHLISKANISAERQYQLFEDIYVCDPSRPRYGFRSWDHFFSRHFRDGVRPIASPEDDNVIVQACESTPRTVQHNVQYSAKFWTKGTPYSLIDMLGHDDLSSHFVSGTVYQAYLNALSYHRWHAPVSGTVVKVSLLSGFYFSKPPYEGFDPAHNLNSEDNLTWSNPYMTAVSTRALVFIQADSTDIGLMAALFVGMTEVSTCEIACREGQRVRKGDEIGLFHCGGSTYCLLFREQVDLLDLPDPAQKQLHPVRGYLARAKSKDSSIQ